MISLWFVLAHGHGGDDHGAPPPPAAIAGSEAIVTWSSEFEAVLRLGEVHAGEPLEATLLLADFGTSAPLRDATAELVFTHDGGDKVTVKASPTEASGVYAVSTTLDREGHWLPSITVLTEARADVLGFPEVHVSPPHGLFEGLGNGRSFGPLLGGIAIGLLLGLGGGAFAARRWGLAALCLLPLSPLSVPEAYAHGGDDHGAPAAPVMPANGVLPLALDSQFLLDLKTEVVRERPFTEAVRALGVTVARAGGAAEIHAPVTGILAFPRDRTFLPGDAVTAGEVLATIAESLGSSDRSAFVGVRAGAQVGLAEARKRLSLAERDLDRAKGLGGVLSDRERLERQKAVEVAQIAVAEAVGTAGLLSRPTPTTTLRAPLSGRISALLARPGDIVSPQDTLFRITDAGGLWVEASVPEAWAGQLQIGASALVLSDGHPEQPLAATVLDPGLEAHPASGSLSVVLALNEPVSWLVPGMTVTASITVGSSRTGIVVPDSAIVDSGAESLVFIKVAPEAFVVRSVRLGALSGIDREVLAGLDVGERVVVHGTYPLRSLAGR